MAKFKMIVSMFIFGTLGIFVTEISMPSATLAAFRALIATIFILCFFVISRRKIDFGAIKNNALLMIISGAAIGVNWIFLFEAYRYTSVATATLCYYMAPVFIIIASPFILKERLTVVKLLCTVSAVAGAALISGASLHDGEFLGVIFGLLAALVYASVVIVNKFIRGIKPLEVTLCQMGSAAVVMLIYSLLTKGFSGVVFDTKTVLLVLLLGIVHTGLAYILFFSGVGSLPAQTSAVLSYIDPVVAVILSSVIITGEITAIQVIGTVLIIGSNLLNELYSAPKSV